jgi:hypothetical protein
MRLGALFGWGIVIYAVTALASSGMVIYGFMQGSMPHIVGILVLFVACVAAGSELKFKRAIDILPYSIGWAAIYMVLNGILFVPADGWELYSSWMLWAVCALVVLFPLCAVYFRKRKGRKRAARGAWES